MVWAFQHFCADETFTLEAARLGIALAGGKQRGPTTVTRFPLPISVTFWDVMIGGHKIGIALGSQADTNPSVQHMVACTVTADGRDVAGIAGLRKWAAIAPSMTPSPQTVIYRFKSEGGKHVAVGNDEAGQVDSYAGKVWQLTLLSGKSTTVTLMRFFRAAERS